MKKIAWLIIFTQLFLFLMAGSSYAVKEKKADEKPQNLQQEIRAIKHVIMISVDGLDEQGMTSAFTPFINSIAGRGIKTSAISVLPGNSSAFTASLFTGSDPTVHGFVKPGQQIKTRSFPEILSSYGRKVVIVGGAGQIPRGLFDKKDNGVKCIETKSKNNRDIVGKAMSVFINEQPYFIGINMSILNGSGNKINKAKAISEIDSEISYILNTLNKFGVGDQSLIIIAGKPAVTDYRKTDTKDKYLVPVIMAGPGLKISSSIPPVRIIDIIPTIALLTGIQIPPECNGLIIWNSLQPGAGFLQENLLLKRIKDLSEINIQSAAEIYKYNEEKRMIKTEQENVQNDKMKIQKMVNGKNDQIRSLKLQIGLLKLLVVVIIIAMAIGYGFEYVYLRKKFLMF